MPDEQQTVRNNAPRIRSVAHLRSVNIASGDAVIQALFRAYEFTYQSPLNPAIDGTSRHLTE
jgi:hypothetical protein